MQYAAIITEKHENDSWGEQFTSTSVVGVLLQKQGEDHDAFRRRARDKVIALEAETYTVGTKTRRLHWGVEVTFHSVIDHDPAFDATLDEE